MRWGWVVEVDSAGVLVLVLGFGEDASDEAEGEEVHFGGFVLGCGGGALWLFSRKICMCVVVCIEVRDYCASAR